MRNTHTQRVGEKEGKITSKTDKKLERKKANSGQSPSGHQKPAS